MEEIANQHLVRMVVYVLFKPRNAFAQLVGLIVIAVSSLNFIVLTLRIVNQSEHLQVFVNLGVENVFVHLASLVTNVK